MSEPTQAAKPPTVTFAFDERTAFIMSAVTAAMGAVLHSDPKSVVDVLHCDAAKQRFSEAVNALHNAGLAEMTAEILDKFTDACGRWLLSQQSPPVTVPASRVSGFRCSGTKPVFLLPNSGTEN